MHKFSYKIITELRQSTNKYVNIKFKWILCKNDVIVKQINKKGMIFKSFFSLK